MNESGALEWEQNLGGSGNDFLRSIRYTADGGYILGGHSDSPVNEVKLDSCRGKHDYWVVKLDAAGKIQWQKTLGGTEDDRLMAVRPLEEGKGYILGEPLSPAVPMKKKKPHAATATIGSSN